MEFREWKEKARYETELRMQAELQTKLFAQPYKPQEPIIGWRLNDPIRAGDVITEPLDELRIIVAHWLR